MVARVFYQHIANKAQFETLSETQEFVNMALEEMRQDM